MSFIARWIVRFRLRILIVALLLFLPCLYGLRWQQIQYDLMSYLPASTPSATGQRILDQEFGYGASAFLLVRDRQDWEVEQLKQRVASVQGVRSVSWIDDLADIAIPRQYLDPNILRQFFRGRATALQVVFSHPGPTLETRKAIKRIQSFLGPGMKLTGQTVALAEMRGLADAEKPRMLLLSLAMVVAILLLTVPSPVVPVLFLLTLGFAVVTNLGLNYFFGYSISYLTNSVAVALQIGVSLDFCIFLWERYREEREKNLQQEEAMSIAIRQTATAVLASAVTTIFGFLALAAMRNGLGADLGITLARGVLFSLAACLTILPSLLLLTDRWVFAGRHASIIPDLGFLARFVPRARVPLLLLFPLLFIPAYYGYSRVRVSYDLESTFPAKLPSIQAAREMRETFGSVDTLNLVTRDIEPHELEGILAQLERIPGVTGVTSYHRVVDPAIPSSFVPDKVKGFFVAGAYHNATISLAEQATSGSTAGIIAQAHKILRPYEGRAFLTGQAAIVGDMTRTAKSDLPRVNLLSLVLIFITLGLSFFSLSLPAILILVVQLAIWFNQGIAYFTGREIFYFGTVAIGAIQLGSTVDYAVLLTTRFREEMAKDRPAPAMSKALRTSARAILTSAGTLFMATMGIYAGTSMELVRGLIVLIARGAIITVAVVLLFLPAVLLAFHRLIGLTTLRWPRAASPDKEVPPCTAD